VPVSSDQDEDHADGLMASSAGTSGSDGRALLNLGDAAHQFAAKTVARDQRRQARRPRIA
jgi:hypothetical protein